MPRVFFASLPALTVIAALMSACAASPAPPAKPPAINPESRFSPFRKQEQQPTIIAPPPAYGNKVVMARLDLP